MQTSTRCVGYIRVSTVRQGTQGVSLPEQRDAILRYAQRSDLEVVHWFEERETAAKQGRPVFQAMLDFVRAHPGTGVIVHKVDRSARNLSDWAEVEELVEEGIDVRLAGDDLDLRNRSGRLAAGIQAVVAADYVRNLREETKKGMYGRLKQGIYPLPAPTGYLDQGAGKPKLPDPLTAPFIRRAFQGYATGNHSLASLREELDRFGLRTRGGGKISLNGLSVVLRNPFYIGLMRLKRTGELFPGAHEPLIAKAVFDQVQARLDGKVHTRGWVNDFLFRRLLTCLHCGYALIGERQKGHTYYRCHTKACPTKGMREEAVDQIVRSTLGTITLTKEEQRHALRCVERVRTNWGEEHARIGAALALRREQLTARLDRLTDAYLDRVIDQPTFTRRKETLLMEGKELDEKEKEQGDKNLAVPDRVKRFLELVSRPVLLYETAHPVEKRSLVELMTSNRAVDGKRIGISLVPPFSNIADWRTITNGAPQRYTPRTVGRLVAELVVFFGEHDVAGIDAWHVNLRRGQAA